jgi:hypothetical protein
MIHLMNKRKHILVESILFLDMRSIGMDWWMDLVTTYAHHTEQQAITAPSLSPHGAQFQNLSNIVRIRG